MLIGSNEWIMAQWVKVLMKLAMGGLSFEDLKYYLDFGENLVLVDEDVRIKEYRGIRDQLLYELFLR